VRYQNLPNCDDAGGGVPAEVDAFGHEPSELVSAVPRRRGDAAGPGRAVKRANHVADRIVDFEHRSAGSNGLQSDRHLSRHNTWADIQALQESGRGLGLFNVCDPAEEQRLGLNQATKGEIVPGVGYRGAEPGGIGHGANGRRQLNRIGPGGDVREFEGVDGGSTPARGG
jgi:hypothetical protein